MPAAVILSPLLNIKLELVENLMKSMVKKNKNEKSHNFSETINFVSIMFSKLSDNKLNNGVFTNIILQSSIFKIKNNSFLLSVLNGLDVRSLMRLKDCRAFLTKGNFQHGRISSK